MSKPPSSPSPGIDDGQSVWAIVEQRLDAFCAAWEAAPPLPDIDAFLVDEQEAVRQFVLIELVKIDLEYRWKERSSVQGIDGYLRRWPELADAGVVPAEILFEEIHQRRRAGDSVDVHHYFSKFPRSADALRRLLGIEAAEVSTSVLAARNPTEFSAGDSIDDFDLRQELGRGAFATVFLALQKSMRRWVALKVSANRGAEPQMLARLDHPHIVRVFDQKILADQDIRLFYMQYVRGGTLQEALQFARRQSRENWGGELYLRAIDEALSVRGEAAAEPSAARKSLKTASWVAATCRVGIQVASALEYAHRQGVLHRDIKPANILLDESGGAKLADFNIGCSKLDSASPAAYFGGSLAYMSPEQLEAYNPDHPREPHELDSRSDLYSLAVVLWEMLVGTRPFADEKIANRWDKTLEDMTARRRQGLGEGQWSQLPSDCPPSLRSFFARALNPDLDGRYASARDMILPLRVSGSAGQTTTKAREWISWVCRWPTMALLIAGVLPNGLSGAFVYTYNKMEAVPAKDETTFFWIQLVLNVLFFSAGMSACVWITRPLVIGLREIRKGSTSQQRRVVLGRERSLDLGRLVTWIGVAEWTAAGLLFPVSLTACGATLGWRAWLDFLGSHALAGMIAATYPFFLLTFMGITAWYPSFLDSGNADESDVPLLRRLARLTSLLEVLAATLPMLAVVLLVTWGAAGNRFALVVLSIASFLGFWCLFQLSRHIHLRIDRLINLLSSPEDTEALA